MSETINFLRHATDSVRLPLPVPVPPAHDWCDICWGKPARKGTAFYRCQLCNVGVHSNCYGVQHNPNDTSNNNSATNAIQRTNAVQTTNETLHLHARGSEKQPEATQRKQKEVEFVCWPCRAIGTSFHSLTTATTTTTTPTQQHRPTECCLCGLDDGTEWYHAMHPIYDCDGRMGQQIVLPAEVATNSRSKKQKRSSNPQQQQNYKTQSRLAWGHTLCCLAIYLYSRTTGCIYPCDAHGARIDIDLPEDIIDDTDDNEEHPDDDSDENDDDDKIELSKQPNARLGNLDPIQSIKSLPSIHHFVYSLADSKKTAKNDPWLRAIDAHQHDLTCVVCGLSDKSDRSLRIPLQCSKSDGDNCLYTQHVKIPNEANVDSNSLCFVSMHVGCAMWGRNSKDERSLCQLVYFIPPHTDSDGNTLARPAIHIFCLKHAHDLSTHSKLSHVRSPGASAKASAMVERNENLESRKTATTAKPNKTASYRTITEKGKNAISNTASETDTSSKIRAADVSYDSSDNVRENDHNDDVDEDDYDHNDTIPLVKPCDALEKRKEAAVRVALREIVILEAQGRQHLQDIIDDAEHRWRWQLDESPNSVIFCEFWEELVDRVCAKFDYSLEPSDWSFLEGNDDDPDKAAAKQEFGTSWETEELFSFVSAFAPPL